MHADDSTIQTIGDLGDGKRGSVGGENAILLADALQALEDFLLQLHLLKSSLNDKIAVRDNLVGSGGNLVQNGVGSSLLHLALRDSLLKALCNLGLAVGSPLCLYVAKTNLVAFCLSKCLCDAGAHRAGANNTNDHDKYPPVK